MNIPDLPVPTTLFEKYLIGSAAPFVATAISFLPELEAWLRIAALVIGIIVSILSFISAEAEKRRRRNQPQQPKE